MLTRRVHADGVYSSTAWPANQPMCMHHELSYRLEVPGLVLFACLQPPTSGGATGVADGAAVLDALPGELATTAYYPQGSRALGDAPAATVSST